MISSSARVALGYTSMLVHAVASRDLLRRPDVRAALVRQIHMTGTQAIPLVVMIALLFGAVVITRALAIVGPDNEYVLDDLVWGGIRELGPLVTALIIITRSGIAIAAEVALMRERTGAADQLWQDAVHEEEFVLPRVLGLAVASAMLVAYFQCTAIGSALLAGAWTLDTTLETQVEKFLDATDWWHVVVPIFKAVALGAGIAAICCYHGMKARVGTAQVPKAVVAACLGSLVFVLVVDLIAVLLWLV